MKGLILLRYAKHELLALYSLLFISTFLYAMEEKRDKKTPIVSLVEICAQAYAKNAIKRCKTFNPSDDENFVKGLEKRTYNLYGYELQGACINDLPTTMKDYAIRTVFENAGDCSISIPSKKQEERQKD